VSSSSARVAAAHGDQYADRDAAHAAAGRGPARLRAAAVEATAQTSLEEPGPLLTLGDLERGLEQVVAAGGGGSVARKIGLLRALLDRATPDDTALLAAAEGAGSRASGCACCAVERGSGRREGWWSNIHLGARDEETGDFVMLGKTFKGMTDETLRWQTETFPPLATRVEGHVMYLRPAVVAQIAFNEIQVSRRYPAGMALRFARLKRYRPDKTPGEADTIETVRRLFAVQEGEDAP